MPDAFAQLFLQLNNKKTTKTNKSVDPTKIHSSRTIGLKHLVRREGAGGGVADPAEEGTGTQEEQEEQG